MAHIMIKHTHADISSPCKNVSDAEVLSMEIALLYIMAWNSQLDRPSAPKVVGSASNLPKVPAFVCSSLLESRMLILSEQSRPDGVVLVRSCHKSVLFDVILLSDGLEAKLGVL
jgi:hypothetical protein